MKWKRILVATDFSAPAGRALESARALAAEAGGTIVLLNVISPPYSIYPQEMLDVGMLSESWIRETRRALAPLVARARRGGLKVRAEVRLGPPWRCILDVAEELAVNAIAIGASGHSRLDRLLLGSTAEKVVRRSPVPVLVTHARALKRIGRVLAPVDLGEGSAWALDVVRHLGARAASIEALLVVPREGAKAGPVVPYYPEAPPLPTMEESDAALEQFLALHALERAHPVVLAAEDVAGGILEHERARRFDLLVIATHGRRGLDRALLGSVAEKVVRHAESPVLVVPERQGGRAVAALTAETPRRGRREPATLPERTRPRGRKGRGPWTGQAHTGRGGPAGRRGVGGPVPGKRKAED